MPKTLISLKQAISILPDAVLVLNENARILMANPQALEAFGYTEAELTGQELFLLIPEELRLTHQHYYQEYLKQPVIRKMAGDMRMAARCKNGEPLDVDIVIAPIQIKARTLIIATIRDIKAQKDMERQLVKKNEALSLKNDQLDHLAMIIAHDLKSPLLNMQALIRLLHRELGPGQTEKAEKYVETLHENLLTTLNLITGIADYSKAGINDRQADEAIDVNQALADVIHLLPVPLTFRIEIGAGLPEIRGNKTKLEQVFLNIINNAIRYNDKPAGHLRITGAPQGQTATFSLQDNGPGIKPEMRGKVFELFQTTGKKSEGSQGIGLAVVKKIIEERGGKVWVAESELGGAGFNFTWPGLMPTAGKHRIGQRKKDHNFAAV